MKRIGTVLLLGLVGCGGGHWAGYGASYQRYNASQQQSYRDAERERRYDEELELRRREVRALEGQEYNTRRRYYYGY